MIDERRAPSTTRGRRIAFRVGAILCGSSVFVLLELFFCAVDWGRPSDHGDPFVGFRGNTPLFVRSDDGDRFEIAPGRLRFFCPDSFAARKAPTEYRVFCLGGSTVQGRPFAIESSFSTWLELSLEAADPDRQFEVVNCGGISYASYRLAPILEEVLGHAPDLIVICTGHNEFLEDRTYEHIKEMPAVVAWPLDLASRLRTFVLIREGISRLRGDARGAAEEQRPVLEAQVDARLDHRGGLDQYHRDDKWRRHVTVHYRRSVSRMVEMCRDAGVPLILLHPVSNLRDCLPFKSEHRGDLTSQELERWKSLVKDARSHYAIDKRRSLSLFRDAIEIDDEHAAIHYVLGGCLEALGRYPEAHEAYRRARDLDICPLRILGSMSADLAALARRTDTPFVDLEELFESLSENGIPGADWLLDHVHPSIRGHQRIAHALAEEMIARGLIDPVDDWKERSQQRFDEHYASLGDLYFAHGVNRLNAVRRWARGEVEEE